MMEYCGNKDNNFYKLLGNTLLVTVKNSFVLFALTFWIYLETRSVIATGVIGAGYIIIQSLCNVWFGNLVDKYDKKMILVLSNFVTLVLFIAGLAYFLVMDKSTFTSVASPYLWLFVLFLLAGWLAGNIYGIALPTLVTAMVPAEKRDKANGLLGMITGIGFTITFSASGIVLGYGSMPLVLAIAIVLSVIALLHVLTLNIPKMKANEQQANEVSSSRLSIATTIKEIKGVPGLFALIFFTTFNNLVGGVFVALIDAYGLLLVSVQVWGIMFGVLSSGIIVGGLLISKYGLGKNPLAKLFIANSILWTVCVFFTIQPSIVLLGIGIFIWMCLIPFIEASEQTIIQKVVPLERQGRVFGFAHSIEQAASPLTALIIAPLAQLIFIPFMTTGAGVGLIGSWFGFGEARGIALVFTVSGMIGLLVTLVAMRSNSYKLLAERYTK